MYMCRYAGMHICAYALLCALGLVSYYAALTNPNPKPNRNHKGSILEKPALLAALPPALAEPTPWRLGCLKTVCLDIRTLCQNFVQVDFMISSRDLAQVLFVSDGFQENCL